MSMRTRAERRHLRIRMIEKAKRMLRQWGSGLETKAPYWADNMAKCSCHLCRGHLATPKPKDADTSYEDEFDWGI